MKYKDLLHPHLTNVLGKIANTQMAPAKSYEVNKLMSAIRAAITQTKDESAEILKNFVKYENGSFKRTVDADGAPTNELEFIEPFSAESPEYHAAMDKFENQDASINFRPWSLEMLGDVKLSAMEIDMLGNLLTDKPFLQAVEEKYN